MKRAVSCMATAALISAPCVHCAKNPPLPTPGPVHHAKTVSIEEAIALALRNSPDIENLKLQRVFDKFALETARNQFELQYSLSGAASYTSGSSPDRPRYSISPGISYLTSIGTKISANYNTNLDGEPGSASLSISQPLLKGFGSDVTMAGLRSAEDAEETAKIGYRASIASTVVQVITAYYGLVGQYNGLKTQIRSMRQTAQRLRTDELRYRQGMLSRNSIEQERASLASARLSMIKQKNSIQQSYQKFLQILGLTPDADLVLNLRIPKMNKLEIPDDATAIKQALAHNPDYQKQLIAMRGTRRALMIAQNQQWWDLNFSATKSLGSSQNGESILGQTLSGLTKPDMTLSLTVPIDDHTRKQALVRAQVALQKAEVSLEKAKRDLISKVKQALFTLRNQMTELHFSEQSAHYQRSVYHTTEVRYHYGKATMFELKAQQTALLNAELSLVSARIGILNQISSLNEMLGLVLKHWHIEVKT